MWPPGSRAAGALADQTKSRPSNPGIARSGAACGVGLISDVEILPAAPTYPREASSGTPQRKGAFMDTSTVTGSGPRAGVREWIGLAVLALPTLLIALDIGLLFLALPHLSADLGASATQQLWITDIYGFMLAGFLVTMGTLGDRIGRRRLLLIGAAGFGAASVAAAFSRSP